ncbi:MAG: alpha/beta hydrolase [Chloroflexota bacterium]
MPSLQSYLLRFLMNRLNAFGGPGTTVQEMRRRGERGMRYVKPAANVTIQAVQAGSVPAEWSIPPYAPATQAVLYFHGGAFVLGSVSTHRAMVSHLALACGSKILSVDYRLAPEASFPAGLDDCAAAYRWLLGQGIAPGRIAVAGDSAGGNLALALLLKLRDEGAPLPAAAACISPVTDLEGTRASRRTRAKIDPILGKGLGNTGLPASYIGDYDIHHPHISPLFAELHGLPPVLIHVGTDEILFDDAIEFADSARQAGVCAEVVVWPRMWHVFQMLVPILPEARQSLAQIAQFIKDRFDDEA